MRPRLFLTALFLAVVSSGSMAREFTLQVREGPDVDIYSMSVLHAQVTGLPHGREPKQFSVKVTLPDGACKALVLTRFEGNVRPSQISIDLCLGEGLILGNVKLPKLPGSCFEYKEWREAMNRDGAVGPKFERNCKALNQKLSEAGKIGCIC